MIHIIYSPANVRGFFIIRVLHIPSSDERQYALNTVCLKNRGVFREKFFVGNFPLFQNNNNYEIVVTLRWGLDLITISTN